MSRLRIGFTLVELLVVIAIVGVLVSLLLPAVNAAREAARRVQCVVQQRQYALAILNFESANGALPVAGLTKKFHPTLYNQRVGPQLSWIVLVLPYLEEQALYDQFVFDPDTLPYEQPEAARLKAPSVGFCPSGQARGRVYRFGEATFAKANYVGYVSPQHVADLPYLPGALGGFRPNPTRITGQSMRKVKDGISGTLAITEVRTLDNPKDHRGSWIHSWGASSVICPDVHHKWDEPLDFYVPDTSLTEQGGINTHRPNSSNYDEIATCFPAVRRESLAAGMPCIQMVEDRLINGAPRSFHPGGVVASALDGHVGFLSNDIDASPLGRLVSVNDGMPLDVTAHLR